MSLTFFLSKKRHFARRIPKNPKKFRFFPQKADAKNTHPAIHKIKPAGKLSKNLLLLQIFPS
jgi:hypothetical protein